MPSFRVVLEILGTQPGVEPADVLPAAEQLLAARHRVEDRHLEVAGATSANPRPEIHLRFLVASSSSDQENLEARAAVEQLAQELSEYARCGDWRLLRGPGRNWRLLAQGNAAAGSHG